MTCIKGSVVTLRASDCEDDGSDCNCTTDDLTFQGAPIECVEITTGDSTTTIIIKLSTAICDLITATTTDTITWCVPNDTAPDADATIVEVLQFISTNLIPRSGNSCDCPVTDNIYFEDTKGIYQCADVGNDAGYVVFNDVYTDINSDTQTRVLSDLRVTAGFGSGIQTITSNLDLSALDTSALKMTYRIDATSNDVTLTLPNLASATGEHSTRVISVVRIDCSTHHVIIDGYSTQTVNSAATVTVPIGRSYILQGLGTNWSILSDYLGCDVMQVQETGDIIFAHNAIIGTGSTFSAKLIASTADSTQVVAIIQNTAVTPTADLLRVKYNGSTVDVIDSVGNLGVGISVPTARVHSKGIDTTSGNYGLLVEDSTGSDILIVRNDSVVTIRSGVNNVYKFSGSTLSFVDDGGIIRQQTITSDLITLSYTRFLTSNLSCSPTSDMTSYFLRTIVGVTSATGGSSVRVFDIQPTINLTGTATANVYGIHIRPTITSILGILYGVIVESGLNGFGKSTPVSTLETGGSFGSPVTAITTNTTLNVSHSTLICDTSAGSITLTLPAANTCTGRIYNIKKKVVANNLVIDPNGAELIDLAATLTLTAALDKRIIQSDGTQWWVIA